MFISFQKSGPNSPSLLNRPPSEKKPIIHKKIINWKLEFKMDSFARLFYFAALPFLLLYATFSSVLFYFLPTQMQQIFFLGFVRYPSIDYCDLAQHGVTSPGRNFYLRNDAAGDGSSTSIGAWHILPASLSESAKALDNTEMERLLGKGPQSVAIYLHGNMYDRTQKHRCKLYNVLTKMDFHVLTIDYRGYGDSPGTPTENGLNSDARALYNYAKKHAPGKDIYIWGHSMGSGVATRLVAELSEEGEAPKALMLEAPFNNLRDVTRNHPLAEPFHIMPKRWFEKLIIGSLNRIGLHMNSEEYIKKITCPILVVHAEDDQIIPVELARKLVASAKSANRTIKYHEFGDEDDSLNHYLHNAPELPDIIRDFISQNAFRENKSDQNPTEEDEISVKFFEKSKDDK